MFTNSMFISITISSNSYKKVYEHSKQYDYIGIILYSI